VLVPRQTLLLFACPLLALGASASASASSGARVLSAAPATVARGSAVTVRLSAKAPAKGAKLRLGRGGAKATVLARRSGVRQLRFTLPAAVTATAGPVDVCAVSGAHRSCLAASRRPLVVVTSVAAPAAAVPTPAGLPARSSAPGTAPPATASPLATTPSSVGATAPEAPAAAADPAGDPAAMAVASPPVDGHAPADLGFFEDLQYLTGTALSKRLDQIAATGAKRARFQMIWSNVQNRDAGTYTWRFYDDLITGLVSRGITPLAVLGTTPTWARPSGCVVETCEPASAAKFGAFARKAAGRYAAMGLHDWEIWNEPNAAKFYKPVPDAGRYAALLKAAGAAIREVDPAATILTGGLAPTDEVRDGAGRVTKVPPLDFLSQVYAAGAGSSFDAVGWHPYTFPRLPGTANDLDAWFQLYGTATNLRAIMEANGDGAKKVWATEFGAHTDPQGEGYVTEARQASILDQGISLWRSLSWAGPMFVYRYQDTGTDQSDREQFFGLVRADGTPKPALGVFKSYASRSSAGAG
jgi:hypothetical protein